MSFHLVLYQISLYFYNIGATQLVGEQPYSEIVASILNGAIITTGGGFSSFQPMVFHFINIVLLKSCLFSLVIKD